MEKKPITNPTILAVLSAGEDRTSLAGILPGSEWTLHFARVLSEARTLLRRSHVDVVISDSRLSDGLCWKDLLGEIQAMGGPPPLIVADRLADEYLWAEVLNLGGYDLLAKPFDAREVRHAVGAANRHFENERRFASGRKPARPPGQKNVTVTKAYIAGAG